eukprot:symbB.v1.2.017987.t1/scaffold1416.1/size119947/7
MKSLDWDKAGEVLDPSEFLASEECSAEEVLDMAFCKMNAKKKQGYMDQLRKSNLVSVVKPQGAPDPKLEQGKSEDELLAKIRAEGRKATEAEIEELLERRRQRWRDTAPKTPSRRCVGCGNVQEASPLQCGGCKTVRYCSQECQKSHWKDHKKKCRRRLAVKICVLSDFA